MTRLRTKRAPTGPANRLAAPEAGRIARSTAQQAPGLVSTARRFPIVDAAACGFEIPAEAENVEIDAYDTDLQSEQGTQGDGHCSIRIMIDNATRCIVAYEVVPRETRNL